MPGHGITRKRALRLRALNEMFEIKYPTPKKNKSRHKETKDTNETLSPPSALSKELSKQSHINETPPKPKTRKRKRKSDVEVEAKQKQTEIKAHTKTRKAKKRKSESEKRNE